MDILISVGAIIFFGPLMLLIAGLIKISDGGPVFFAHRRIGFNGAAFDCLKFRTMAQDAEKALADYLERNEDARRQWNELHKLTHDPRITRLGQFLRLSSLDELPQFFCVLMGHMSIVGPRPIVEKESARYGRYFADYCFVRPGLTGLWQVSGRNDTSYRRRVAIDVFYCRNWSLALDLLVILKTPGAIIKRSGVY
ncbi:sugar transferase [Allopontixanthobacter sp.]|uniref:sugar transferase n=1 Tax=Allopontixanthobacter sp. TaxID=2906452 RepID=UPI002ABA9F47|nr:sugar transferase [Allopontixanthobacter sp.]MDZ4307590.1 sugar transferase [Allopontixanthobacter sp.]